MLTVGGAHVRWCYPGLSYRLSVCIPLLGPFIQVIPIQTLRTLFLLEQVWEQLRAPTAGGGRTSSLLYWVFLALLSHHYK